LKGLKGNAIVGQSGGPTAAINASLAGVVGAAKKSEVIDTIYGMVNGIVGVLNDNIINLSEIMKTDEDVDILKHTPSSYLRSCRYKLPKAEDAPEVYKTIFERFAQYDIKYFFYIGGNDSMDSVMKISNYASKIGYEINVIGVPKTVDNDLLITDHTPGFGSAARYIAASISELMGDCDVYDIDSVNIVEIMGRNAGWMTAASALARRGELDAPQLIYLPEVAFDTAKFIEDLKRVKALKKNVIVAVSEGCRTKDGAYICEGLSDGPVDSFGHKKLSGAARALEVIVKDNFPGVRTRVIEFSLLQRCAMHFASKTDLDESERIGQAGVRAAEDGQTGMMMIYVRQPGEYKISIDSYDINKIANGEKTIPNEWITDNGTNVSQEFLDYARPLIEGQPELHFKDGLPLYKRLP